MFHRRVSIIITFLLLLRLARPSLSSRTSKARQILTCTTRKQLVDSLLLFRSQPNKPLRFRYQLNPLIAKSTVHFLTRTAPPGQFSKIFLLHKYVPRDIANQSAMFLFKPKLASTPCTRSSPMHQTSTKLTT